MISLQEIKTETQEKDVFSDKTAIDEGKIFCSPID